MKGKDLLKNIHPGEVLLEDFLTPMGISQHKLAKDTGMPDSRITRIIKGEQAITVDTAIRLALFFGTSEKFWLGLQTDYDLAELKAKKYQQVRKTVKPFAKPRRRRAGLSLAK